MNVVRILPDRYWWKNCETGQLVPYSRHQDPCFYRKFPGNYPYPAPVSHWRKPKGGDNFVQITQPWWDFVKAINTEEAWRVLRRNNGGWINYASNPEWPPGETVPDPPNPFPKVEGITSIENYHLWEDRLNGSARILTFLLANAPPDPAVVNPQTRPELFCHFTSISSTGRVGNAPNGVLSYFPLLAKDEAWIPDEKLEYLDALPEVVMGTYEKDGVFLKNQGMINFFYAAFDVPETGADEAWPVIERAGLESIAADRQAVYEGPPVGEMSISYNEKVLLRDELRIAGYEEPPIAPPAGGVDVSQAIQVLYNARESNIATGDSIQTALDILEVPVE